MGRYDRIRNQIASGHGLVAKVLTNIIKKEGDEKMFESNGTQYQLPSMEATYHEGDDVTEFIERTSARIQKTFEGETQHKVIKATHRRTKNYKLLSFPTSLDPVVLTTLEDWLKEKIKKEYAPVTFDFQFFLSSEEPKI